MPPKTDPRDWERLFEGRRRRHGPLRIVMIALIAGILILGLIGSVPFVLDQIEASRVVTRQTQIVQQTREARAATQRAAAQSAIAMPTQTPSSSPTATLPPASTPAPIIGRAQVINGGNIRSAPRISADTVIGQVCVGDRVELLEEQTIGDNNRWYRLRVVATADDCVSQRVSAGTEGWVSATLLSRPEP
ncbi:SH3 domain-containing protein [Chloroflexus sp.]|uniref:SH3 domain-containing protein n=1 Tax=Chloroflexus sp. TaxID=1904827 RepID=UPI0040493FEF